MTKIKSEVSEQSAFSRYFYIRTPSHPPPPRSTHPHTHNYPPVVGCQQTIRADSCRLSTGWRSCGSILAAPVAVGSTLCDHPGWKLRCSKAVQHKGGCDICGECQHGGDAAAAAGSLNTLLFLLTLHFVSLIWVWISTKSLPSLNLERRDEVTHERLLGAALTGHNLQTYYSKPP